MLDKRYIGTKEAEARYDIPARTQEKLRSSGRMPHETVKRKVVYDTEVLDPLAENGSLGTRAYRAIMNLQHGDTAEEHY